MKEIYKKVFAIQQEIESLKRDTEGYNYKYATLDQVVEKLKPLFKKYNLILIQPVVDNVLTTQLIDIETEQLVESKILLADLIGSEQKTKAQSYGSAITYARRYAIGAMLGLVTEDDDDGASAGNNTSKKAEYNQEHVGLLKEALEIYPEDKFLLSLKDAIKKYKSLTEKQVQALYDKMGMAELDSSVNRNHE